MSRYDADADVKILTQSAFVPRHATIVVTHGRHGTEDEARFIDLHRALAAMHPERNIVRVTWQGGAAGLPWSVLGHTTEVAQAAYSRLRGMGYARWGDAIYIGESAGNAVNAAIAGLGNTKGQNALILNAPHPFAYFPRHEPDFRAPFRRSIAIQTRDLFDSKVPPVDIRLLSCDPRHLPFGARRCSRWGESHVSGIPHLTRLLQGSPDERDLAGKLVEGSLTLEDQPDRHWDGILDFMWRLRPVPAPGR